MAGRRHLSPIVKAIAGVETISTAEIRVHVSERLLEKDPFSRARFLFRKFGMHRSTHRNGVLLYINLRKKVFAIVFDEGVRKTLEPNYWNSLSQKLKEDLRATYYENAIALSVLTIGVTLGKHFPREIE